MLVTGAGGFVGRSMVSALTARGHKVVCFDHFVTHSPESIADENVEIVKGDIRNRDDVDRAMQGVDSVFHLAAALVTRSMEASRSVNVEGTRTLAESAAEQTKPPVFVFVSSLAAAGPRSTPSREEDPCQPVCKYGITKLEAEDVLKKMADRMPITIVRPPCVFGTRDKNMLSLYKSVKYGWNFVASREYEYSFLHVEDLVEGMLAASERGERLSSDTKSTNQGVYFLSDPQPVTFVELGDMIASSLGIKRVRHIKIPRPICWVGGLFGEIVLRLTGVRMFLNMDKIKEAFGGSFCCDVARAEQQLHFSPATNLPARIDETKEFYESAGWL